ncbi:hypothetical protein Q7C36_020353 [Tachysurus vachellii]|uniref:Uncharacterized protein n=1 Tax=Tachysurus vachellii TaxID=175792 RepID=A0AA88LTK3_TACVA|nr:hypothetical protein Q7C36_020353 [Tachysurus vachellii]
MCSAWLKVHKSLNSFSMYDKYAERNSCNIDMMTEVKAKERISDLPPNRDRMKASCSQAVICVTPWCSCFFDSEDGLIDSNSITKFLEGKTFGMTDRKKNQRNPCGHFSFSVGETLDRSFGIECQNDVCVDRPDKVKDINESPEETAEIES